MRYFFALIVLLTLASPAPAAMKILPLDTITPDPVAVPGGNDFKADLDGTTGTGLDFTQIFNGGADILFTAAGFLTFEYYGAESSFHNTFSVSDGTTDIVKSETADANLFGGPASARAMPGILAVGGSTGITKFSQLTNGTTILAAGFTTDDLSTGQGVAGPAGSAGFGVFITSATWTSTSEYTDLFLGYDDNGAGPDDNHDDMMIRVRFFRPGELPEIPEPVSLLAWGGLACVGLGFRSRRRRNAG